MLPTLKYLFLLLALHFVAVKAGEGAAHFERAFGFLAYDLDVLYSDAQTGKPKTGIAPGCVGSRPNGRCTFAEFVNYQSGDAKKLPANTASTNVNAMAKAQQTLGIKKQIVWTRFFADWTPADKHSGGFDKISNRLSVIRGSIDATVYAKQIVLMQDAFDQIIKFRGIEDLENEYKKAVSYGNKQDPKILLDWDWKVDSEIGFRYKAMDVTKSKAKLAAAGVTIPGGQSFESWYDNFKNNVYTSNHSGAIAGLKAGHANLPGCIPRGPLTS